MITSLDKAIAAAIMGIVFVLNNVYGLHFGLTQEQANSIAAVIGPLLVYLIPNKAKE